MDKDRFERANELVRSHQQATAGIGRLSEKTLHSVLKYYFEPNEEKQEVKIQNFYADILNETGIIEIQTQGFDKLRKKLELFLTLGSVTVIYPIARTKWLSWVDQETGEVSERRKSPKTGRSYDAFRELYKIKPLLAHPNLRIGIVLLEIQEYRYLNGWSRDKKKGSSRCDRVPLGIVDELYFDTAESYSAMVPDLLASDFTSKDYRSATKLTQGGAQKALHVLHHIGALKRTGKIGNSYTYDRVYPSL